MSNIFKTSKPPKPDQDLLAQQKMEEKRAEADRIRALQDQLSVETRLRNRQFGIRSLLGSLGTSLKSLLGSG
jgi:hypothetical protein